MVKQPQNQPLQIRLTEPVIFLRGPSTGFDFRGRPQVVRDGQPAMLRGLLTLRLSKPTRVRSITVKLEGKARTEWPEGIGPRRIETHEEHEIISDSLTFFSAQKESENGQRHARRATSIGPGLDLARFDLDDEAIDEEVDLPGVPSLEGGAVDPEDLRGRGRGRSPVRSSSAIPGDSGGSRPPRSNRYLDAQRSMRGRGPSPAYTLYPENHQPGTARDPGLTPIVSAAPSRAASEGADSNGTERRYPSSGPNGHDIGPVEEDMEWVRTPTADSPIDPIARALERAWPSQGPANRSILTGRRETRSASGIRFAETPSVVEHHSGGDNVDGEDESRLEGETARTNGRAASLRTIDSAASAASETTDTASQSSHEHTTAELAHPVMSAVHARSAVSTRHNSPAPSRGPSRAPSIRDFSLEDATTPQQDTVPLPLPPPLRPDDAPSASSSRRGSSFLPHLLHLPHSLASSAASSSVDLTETRPGKVTKSGRTSTIVTNLAPGPVDAVASPSAMTPRSSHSLEIDRPSELPRAGPSGTSGGRIVSGQRVLSPQSSTSALRAPSTIAQGSMDVARGRRNSRFSLGAALRGLSQDVKDRVSSRQSSKSRTGTVSRSRIPSSGEIAASAAIGGPRVASTIRTYSPSGSRSTSRQPSAAPSRRGRGSFSQQDPDFVPPGGGRGGAGRVNSSRERAEMEQYDRLRQDERARMRTSSPAPMGVESGAEDRTRGRKKGMKVLTGRLGLDHHDSEEEDVHNWKEFKKGVYNYPISFPIPADTPPTIHAEFGSVSYRLKATVVRVGALTPNLVDDTEVTMIATPQEDDMEESENVIVERQWEEQMRYQIALSGKAFPIGGTIPISVRLMPLQKCKVHRLTVSVEEKTDYFALGRKVARHETPRKFQLLFVKQPDKLERIEPLLPILSSRANAARESPLAPLAHLAAVNNPIEFSGLLLDSQDPATEDEMFAHLLDPMGPWHLEAELHVPDCAQKVRFSTKHQKTNITVGHTLKVTIRVERGDDVAMDAKGRRKQFDIIIETPIKILDCRVNPNYNSLPTYSSAVPLVSTNFGVCSVHGNSGSGNSKAPALSPSHLSTASVTANSQPAWNWTMPTPSREPSRPRDRGRDQAAAAVPSGTSGLNSAPPASSASSGPNGAPTGQDEDTLLERNIVYDRLMSGQETETGEHPPAYDEVTPKLESRSRSRSTTPSGYGRAQTLRNGANLDGPPVSAGMERGGSGPGRSRSRLATEIILDREHGQ